MFKKNSKGEFIVDRISILEYRKQELLNKMKNEKINAVKRIYKSHILHIEDEILKEELKNNKK